MSRKGAADEWCGIRFTSENSSGLHMATYNDHRLKCAKCDNSFSTPSSLQKHQVLHFGKEFVCNMCNFATLHRGNLKRHIRLHEREDSHSLTKNELIHHGHWTKTHKKTEKTFIYKPRSSGSKTSGLTNIEFHDDDDFIEEHQRKKCNEKHQTTIDYRVSHTVKNHNGDKSGNCLKKEKSLTTFRANKVKKSGVEKPLLNSSSFGQQKCTRLVAGHARQVNKKLNAVQDEARKIKSQSSMLTSVPALLPLLERLLELSACIAKKIPKAIKKEVRLQYAECLEYLLHTIKMVIVRWEDLIGLMYRDTSLNAIQYAYGTLPIFTNWEKNEHLQMLENILLLILNTVKNKQCPPVIGSDVNQNLG
ncbi:zinc finger protein 91-like [Daphnia carinata]|uniref:zinc finger protein 91-like n=1 Tax=Daphnia carinata TaxID=120202 RepID=UPI00257EEE64|nr:zinc finger protein 91-like [Daphnia carinata]